jgi:hypothetical protein
MCCRAANFLDAAGERLSRHCETAPKLEVLLCSVIDMYTRRNRHMLRCSASFCAVGFKRNCHSSTGTYSS